MVTSSTLSPSLKVERMPNNKSNNAKQQQQLQTPGKNRKKSSGQKRPPSTPQQQQSRKSPHHKKQAMAYQGPGSQSQPVTPVARVQMSSPLTCKTPNNNSKVYAGSKCYEPPMPGSLPKPKWVGGGMSQQGSGAVSGVSPFQQLVASMQQERERQDDSRDVAADEQEVSQHLKLLLNVQA